MRLNVLVEGPSEEALLSCLLPRLLPRHTFDIIKHQGKGRLRSSPRTTERGLLDQLLPKLRAYGRSLNPSVDRVLVLVDADNDDCRELKRRLTRALARIHPQPTALFRIAVEETEAFYLGDRDAIRRAFPRANLGRLRGYVQDSVCGTWELFREVVGATDEDKVAWAQAMAPVLSVDPNGNASPSFRQFRRACRELAGEPTD